MTISEAVVVAREQYDVERAKINHIDINTLEYWSDINVYITRRVCITLERTKYKIDEATTNNKNECAIPFGCLYTRREIHEVSFGCLYTREEIHEVLYDAIKTVKTRVLDELHKHGYKTTKSGIISWTSPHTHALWHIVISHLVICRVLKKHVQHRKELMPPNGRLYLKAKTEFLQKQNQH